MHAGMHAKTCKFGLNVCTSASMLVKACAVFALDLELGVVHEATLAGTLDGAELEQLLASALPDSTGDGSEQGFVVSLAGGGAFAYCAYCCRRDPQVARGFVQKSLVLVTTVYAPLFRRLASLLAATYLNQGAAAFASAADELQAWPAAPTGGAVQLHLAGVTALGQLPRGMPAALQHGALEHGDGIGLLLRCPQLLPQLWVLWELLLCGRPLLVHSESAAVCSEASLGLATLLAPLCFSGELLPYVSSRAPQLGALLDRAERGDPFAPPRVRSPSAARSPQRTSTEAAAAAGPVSPSSSAATPSPAVGSPPAAPRAAPAAEPAEPTGDGDGGGGGGGGGADESAREGDSVYFSASEASDDDDDDGSAGSGAEDAEDDGGVLSPGGRQPAPSALLAPPTAQVTAAAPGAALLIGSSDPSLARAARGKMGVVSLTVAAAPGGDGGGGGGGAGASSAAGPAPPPPVRCSAALQLVASKPLVSRRKCRRLLRKLLEQADRHGVPPAQLLAAHFDQLTRAFLAPFEPYLRPRRTPDAATAATAASASTTSTSAASAAAASSSSPSSSWSLRGPSNRMAQLEPFDADAFLSGLAAAATAARRPAKPSMTRAATAAATAAADAAGNGDALGTWAEAAAAEDGARMLLRTGRRGVPELYARFISSAHFLPWLQEARQKAVDASGRHAPPRHPAPPPPPAAATLASPLAAGPSSAAAATPPTLDAWQLWLLQQQATETCEQRTQEYRQLRGGSGTVAAGAGAADAARARAASWRRVQSAELHLVWLRSLGTQAADA